MKKTVLLIIILLSLLFITACSNNEPVPIIKDDVPEKVLTETHNLSACYEITDPENQGHCISEIALLSDDLDLCFKAGPIESACLEAVANARGDSSICKYVTRDAYKDSCYTDAAVAEKNPALCEEVFERQRSACYMNYAELVGNVSVCNNVLSTFRDNCYQLVAFVENKITICDKISNKGSLPFSKCVNDIAVETGAYSYCTRLPTSSTVDLCRYKVALEHNNIVACDSIIGEDKKAQCISELS